jgi:hypothetical protein
MAYKVAEKFNNESLDPDEIYYTVVCAGVIDEYFNK